MPKSSGKIKYGLQWPEDRQDIQIELDMIKFGGYFTTGGQTYGKGLAFHYKSAIQLLWPEDDWHRWMDVTFGAAADNAICSWSGSSDSGKSYSAAKWALIEYWAAPKDTLVIISSDTKRGIEMRIGGAIKRLFNSAKTRFPFLDGKALDSQSCITTDEIDEEAELARAINRGIVWIPCFQNGKYVGIRAFHGIKAPRLRQASDETQAMSPMHLDGLPNFVGKDFRGLFLMNPTDPTDPGGRISEPVCGWSAYQEPLKTEVYKTKMFDGLCVVLVGSDSPNFDYPEDQPKKFKYLIGREKFRLVASAFGKDSQQYYSQCMGVMKTGLMSKRVITVEMAKQHKAFDEPIWEGSPTVRIWGLDAAYGGIGGDRCVFIWGEFGEAYDGQQILSVGKPELIPVSIKKKEQPEAQIANWIRERITLLSIPPQNGGYDSTGRGTLGNAFAKVFGHITPQPIEFGGRPSKRPVRHDLFVKDEQTKLKRPMRCDEHYCDFVSELWMTTRYMVECEQIRNIDMEIIEEGQQREYGLHKKKTFVESKNDPKAKERMRRSPDLYDAFVTLCEMARRMGFELRRLGVTQEMEQQLEDDYDGDIREVEAVFKKACLTHA